MSLPLPDDLATPRERKRDRVAFWVATSALVVIVAAAAFVLIGAPS